MKHQDNSFGPRASIPVTNDNTRNLDDRSIGLIADYPWDIQPSSETRPIHVVVVIVVVVVVIFVSGLIFCENEL